jgi:hypothetical protein
MPSAGLPASQLKALRTIELTRDLEPELQHFFDANPGLFVQARTRRGVEMGRLANTLRVMVKPLAGDSLAHYLSLVQRNRPEPPSSLYRCERGPPSGVARKAPDPQEKGRQLPASSMPR